MRTFSAGGSTRTRILGEALPNLHQDSHSSELEDLLGLKVRYDDGIEAEVTYDDIIDVKENVISFKEYERHD